MMGRLVIDLVPMFLLFQRFSKYLNYFVINEPFFFIIKFQYLFLEKFHNFYLSCLLIYFFVLLLLLPFLQLDSTQNRWTLKNKALRKCFYRSASFDGQSQFDPPSVQIRLQRWSQFRHLRNGKLFIRFPFGVVVLFFFFKLDHF